MFGQLFNSARNLVFIGVILVILITLGNVIALYTADWLWLTYFFKIIRDGLALIDFMVDTDTLITLVGYSLLIQVGLWTYKGTLAAIKFLKQS